MDTQRQEIINLVKNSNNISVIKKETGLDVKNILAFDMIVVGIGILFYYIAKDIDANIVQFSVYFYIICGMLIVLSLPMFSLHYSVALNSNDSECAIDKSYMVFGFIRIWKKHNTIRRIEAISLVRLSKIATYLEAGSIQKTLGIKNKYVLFMIGQDYSYDRIIGFNNYVEAGKIVEQINEVIKSRKIDATENEYRDEDDYISSYIRYQNMLKEIKGTSV